MKFKSTTGVVFVYSLLGMLAATPSASFADGGYETAGNLLTLGLPIVAAGIAVAQDDAEGLWQLAKAETAALVTTQMLKYAVHETRPNGQDDMSFPSRHAAVSFAAAQYLQTRHGWEYGLPAYAAAALAGYSRVRAHEHYWKDVAAGAVIGMASSYYFTDSREGAKLSVMAGLRGANVQWTSRW